MFSLTTNTLWSNYSAVPHQCALLQVDFPQADYAVPTTWCSIQASPTRVNTNCHSSTISMLCSSETCRRIHPLQLLTSRTWNTSLMLTRRINCAFRFEKHKNGFLGPVDENGFRICILQTFHDCVPSTKFHSVTLLTRLIQPFNMVRFSGILRWPVLQVSAYQVPECHENNEPVVVLVSVIQCRNSILSTLSVTAGTASLLA